MCDVAVAERDQVVDGAGDPGRVVAGHHRHVQVLGRAVDQHHRHPAGGGLVHQRVVEEAEAMMKPSTCRACSAAKFEAARSGSLSVLAVSTV